MRDLPPPLFLLIAVALVVAFFIGKRIEGGRDAGWQDAAQRLQGRFRGGASAGDLAVLGPAPWTQWAADGELQFTRAIDASAPAPFTLLQVRYSMRERRGEEHPDSWYEVTVAAVPLARGKPVPGLQPILDGDYAGADNGRTLYLWKKGSPGAGASLTPTELPELLQRARALAGRR